MATLDWDATPLGPRADWPQTLRIATDLMLQSRFPMFLLWGPRNTCLYNDAYIPLLGARHPSLGRSFRDIFPEAWAEISPLIERTRGGEACFFEDWPLTLQRNGYPEQAWFTFSYSPLRDEAGLVQGMFCACTETTARIQAEADRRGSEARRRQLLESITDCFYALDDDWRFTYVNPQAATLLGHRPEDMLGASIWTLFPGFAGGPFEALYRDVMRTREPATTTAHYPDHDRWYEVRAFPAEAGISVFFGDVSERERVQATLRQTEERLALALEGTDDGLWDWDIRSGEVHNSARFVEMLGYAPGEWEASLGNWRAHIHPDDAPAALERMRAYLEGETKDYASTFRMRHRAGHWLWVLSRAKAVRDAQGKAVRMAGAHTDITPQKQAEAALRESEARFRLLADTLPLVLYTAGPGGTVDWLNEHWYAMTGAPRGAQGADGWLTVVHPGDHGAAQDAWEASIRDGTPYEVQLRFFDQRTGQHRWHLSRAIPVRDALGQVARWVGTATDIDDQRRAAEVLARSRAELERLVEERTAEFRRAAEERHRAEEALRHSEKLQALGQLTGGIAHDFNNVLQVVESGLHLLRNPALAGEGRQRVLDGVAQAAGNARALIGQLTAFARQQPLDPVPIDLNARLGGMAGLLRHSLGAQVRLETALDPDLPRVVLDSSQLETAVLNLVMNARDAMPEGGRLTLATSQADGRVVLSVSDTGEGIAPEQQARIFEPFFTTKPPGKGTGLGLAQVHGFVLQSGGAIDVESVPGRGTNFRLALPPARTASTRSSAR